MIGKGIVGEVRVIAPQSEYALKIRNAEFVRSKDGSWKTDSDNGHLVLVSDMLDAIVHWYGTAGGLDRALGEALQRVEMAEAEVATLRADLATKHERVVELERAASEIQGRLDETTNELKRLQKERTQEFDSVLAQAQESGLQLGFARVALQRYGLHAESVSDAIELLGRSRDWFMRECAKRGGPEVEASTQAGLALQAIAGGMPKVTAGMQGDGAERPVVRFETDHGPIIVRRSSVTGIAPADRCRTFLFLGGSSVKVEAAATAVAVALGWAEAPAEGAGESKEGGDA